MATIERFLGCVKKPLLQEVQKVEPVGLAPERNEPPYPSTILGVLKRLEEELGSGNTFIIFGGLSKAYDSLLAIQQKQIKSFQDVARKKGLPWQDEIVSAYDINEQDGFLWDNAESLTLGEDFIKYLLKSKTVIVSSGHWNHEEIELVSDPNCQEIRSVRHTKSITSGYGKEKNEKILKHIEVKFQGGSPAETSIIKNSKPDEKQNMSFNLKLTFNPSILPSQSDQKQ